MPSRSARSIGRQPNVGLCCTLLAYAEKLGFIQRGSYEASTRLFHQSYRSNPTPGRVPSLDMQCFLCADPQVVRCQARRYTNHPQMDTFHSCFFLRLQRNEIPTTLNCASQCWSLLVCVTARARTRVHDGALQVRVWTYAHIAR